MVEGDQARARLFEQEGEGDQARGRHPKQEGERDPPSASAAPNARHQAAYPAEARLPRVARRGRERSRWNPGHQDLPRRCWQCGAYPFVSAYESGYVEFQHP